MKKINFLSLFIIILLFSGCKKDFLTLNPLGSQDLAYLKTADGATQAVTGCYNVLQWDITYARNQWSFGDVASDDAMAGGSGSNDQIDMHNIDNFTIASNNSYCRTFWRGLYVGIGRCNAVTEYVKDGDFDASLKSRLIGEAKFLKALYYFNLVITFGPVPAFDKPLTPAQYTEGQSSWSDIWSIIESNLRDAIAVLPEKSQYASTDMGRATKGAAQALLMKVLIFESSYAKYGTPGLYGGVSERWKDVISIYENSSLNLSSSSQYSLIKVDTNGIGNLKGDYNAFSKAFSNIFSIDTKNNGESIFEIQTSKDLMDGPYTDTPDRDFNHFENQGIILAIYQMPRKYIDKKGINHANTGWGFDCPTPDLANEFEIISNGNTTIADPRKAATIAFSNISNYKLSDTFQLDANTWVYFDNSISPSKMSARKYNVPYNYWNTADKGHPQYMNMKLIRYTDALLWAAEAYMEDKQSSKAQDILTAIRARVGLPPTPTAKILNNSTYKKLDPLQAAIYHERRVELALEGHRFYDVIRTGLANGKNGTVLGANFVSGTNERFPISESDIIYSGGNLKQNPGY